MADYWSNFRSDRVVPHLTPSLRLAANIRIDFTSPKTRMIVLPNYLMLKPHDRMFIRLDKTPKRDGRTDGQTNRIIWLLRLTRSKKGK